MRPLRRLSLALVGLIFLSCGFRLQAFGTDAARQMQVGIASVDITPDYPVRLNGFGMRRQPSEGVRQHLYARAMAIGTGDENTAVILTVDTLGIPDDLTERLALKLSVRGIRREQLAICASHTHSGPMIRNCANTLFGEPIPDDHWKAIVSYSDQLERSLEQVALKALDDRRPASVFFGIGQAGFAVNRRTAGGPVDHDVPVLAIRNSDHSLRAVFVNYACHCVTLSDNLLSGDWAGYAMDHLQRMYPDCEALISIGCGADANPRGGVLGSQSDVADQLGLELAEAVRKVLNGSMTPMTESLDCQLERVILPLDSLPTRDEWLDKAKRDDAIGHHARTQLSRLDRGEPLMTEVSYPVQSISFGGELSMVFLPGEVVVDYATRLKGELDRNRLWLHAYSNACPGYIPSERILREGGYEGGAAMVYYDIPTRYQAGIEDKIVRAVIRQIGNRLKPEQDASRTDGIAPKTPREALASLQLKPEFSAELVAAEPLIESPVAIAFGPDGRLWVAEMSDYPQGRPEGDGEHEPGGSIRC
ncbi:MAG: neutral/alkaline non-lysosomal ceramidase N-terminal domain-containing protein, partial [Planctomycetota bacterium]